MTLPAWSDLSDTDRHEVVLFLRTVELEGDFGYVAESYPLGGRFTGTDPHTLDETYGADYDALTDTEFARLYDLDPTTN